MGPMMRLVLGLVVLALILGGVALGFPSHVTVQRSVVINAPEYAIFPYLNNLRRFPDWSPWSARDPNMKVTYSGPEQGKGAKIEWASEQPSIGAGNMEIVESEPSRNVSLTANFNGLEGTSSYELSPDGAGSKVTWGFGYDSGSSPLKRWKALMLDGFIGAEYRTGLERLKARVEEDRRPAGPAVVVPPQPIPQVPPSETVVPQSPGQGVQPAPAPEQPPAAQATPQPGAPPPPPRAR
ncbi:MAG: SRPBCC family protein [Methyloceanibacter sp.]|uniref:SRPBCC family protein n=1 Tax=Methyloceanibacter sp. TaxID=1965321 RepID=UPI003D6C8796